MKNLLEYALFFFHLSCDLLGDLYLLRFQASYLISAFALFQRESIEMLKADQHVPITHLSDAGGSQQSEAKVHCRSIIREFLLNTLAHALPWIARSKNFQNRVFWSISFIVFTAIMTFFVIGAIMDYYEYPTKFNTNFVEEWPQYFPAFSLCHASPLRLDRIIEIYLNYTKSLNLNISNDTKIWS